MIPALIPPLKVITVFSSGTKVTFTIDHKDFFDTMTRDKLRRLDMWLDSDNNKEFENYYKVTDIEFNNHMSKMTSVELTPTEGT